jgi:PilZ domain-containing protein
VSIKNSIARTLRRSIANRRRAARRKAQRKARLMISVSLTTGGETTMPLEGYTRDISEDGLAIIVPSLRVGDTYLNSEDCTVRVVLLEVPAGSVEIYATPVRYQYLEVSGPEEGHLLGLRITKMSDEDRARYDRYLRSLP